MTLPPLPFKVKTTVSWPGEESGDLGFLENELIQVFSIVDESWWSGKLRRNGAEGIFPREYVTIMEDEASRTPPSGMGTPTKKKYTGDITTSVDRIPKQASNTMLNYKVGDMTSPKGSYDRMNQSFDGVSPSVGKAMPSYAFQGGNMKLSQQKQLQLQRDRDMELEYFKRMQQQLKQQEQQLKNYKLHKSTLDLSRNMMVSLQSGMAQSQSYTHGNSYKSNSYGN